MRQQDAYQFLKTQDYQAIRLPYRNSGIAMSLIVPIGAGGIGMMDRALDVQAPNILSALARAPRTTVDLSLPLFKTEFRADLVPLFQALGMTLAFDRDRADFSGMTGRIEESKRLHISHAEHRAFIDVNEAGTEAGASTAVEIAKRARPAQVLKIDRPFLYLIADEASGAILFVGRVMDPRAPAAQR
jgi:serpin B